ncbi:hypothetical protein D3C71_1099340 [compost metagenome]
MVIEIERAAIDGIGGIRGQATRCARSQCARIHRRAAAIGVCAGERQCASARFGQPACAGDRPRIGRCRSLIDGKCRTAQGDRAACPAKRGHRERVVIEIERAAIDGIGGIRRKRAIAASSQCARVHRGAAAIGIASRKQQRMRTGFHQIEYTGCAIRRISDIATIDPWILRIRIVVCQ